MVGTFAFCSQETGKPLGGFELTCVSNQSPQLAAMCRTDRDTTEGKSGAVSYTLSSSGSSALDQDNGDVLRAEGF